MDTKSRLFHNYKNYFSNLLLFWPIVHFFINGDYYSQNLYHETHVVLFNLALGYTLIGLFTYAFIPVKLKESRALIFFRIIKNVLFNFYNLIFRLFKVKGFEKFDYYKFDKNDKTTILFLIVKFYFIPIMFNFLIGNYYTFKNMFENAFATHTALETLVYTNATLLPLIIVFLTLVDVAIFSFGYVFESKLLNNIVRSVEPTFLGWAVALVCYPPFNTYYSQYIISWYASDNVAFHNVWITLIANFVMIILFSIYVWASVALGPKASNLTNRGIVSSGPYKFIRHPAYICKNLMWWISIIPIFSLMTFLSMLSWSVIYYLRIFTEERHLSMDKDYVLYKKKVKYKIIPYVW